MDDNSVYLRLSRLVLSYNCERQGELFLKEAEKYLHDDFSLKHSVIRLAVRPLFYAGYGEEELYLWLKGRTASESFRENNRQLVGCVFKELELCGKYYGSDHDRGEFFADFRRLGLNDDEIERIYHEETEQ